MTTCPDGHIVTQHDLIAASGRLSNAFQELQNEGQVSHSMKLVLVNGYPGVANASGGHGQLIQNRMAFDPQYGACMTENSIKAVMLHESRHPQQPIMPLVPNTLFDFGMAATLILVPLFRTARAAIRNLRGTWGHKRNWPLLRIAATGWTLGGVVLAYQLRPLETDADLYAAKVMGTPQYMQEAIKQLDQIKPDGSTENSDASGAYIGLAVTTIVAALGPVGMWISHSPVSERIKILERNREDIEYKRQSHPKTLSVGGLRTG